VKSLWERYVEDRWWAWAEEDRKLRNVRDVWAKLLYSGLKSSFWKRVDG